MQTSTQISKTNINALIDDKIKHSYLLKMLKSCVDKTQNEDEIKKLFDDIEKIVEISKAISDESQPLQVKWDAIDETYRSYIMEDYRSSSQGFYLSSAPIFEYDAGWPILIDSSSIPSLDLSKIAKLYRYPISEFGLNYGFMIELQIGDCVEGLIQRLVSHSYGYSTWQYVDQEVDFDDFKDADSIELFESIEYEHLSESKEHDDIVLIK